MEIKLIKKITNPFKIPFFTKLYETGKQTYFNSLEKLVKVCKNYSDRKYCKEFMDTDSIQKRYVPCGFIYNIAEDNCVYGGHAFNNANMGIAACTGESSVAIANGESSVAVTVRKDSVALCNKVLSAAVTTEYCSTAIANKEESVAVALFYKSTAVCKEKSSIAIAMTSSFVIAEHPDSIAIAMNNCEAKGTLGSHLLFKNGEDVKLVKVDGVSIKPNVFYKYENGEIITTEIS